MNLSPQQRKQLREALMNAFLSKKKLEIVLKEELDKDLDAIVGGADLGEITFELIKLADSEGWVEDLIRAASQSNPGNPLLKDIAQELLTFHQTSSSNIDRTDSTQQITLQTYSQTISQKTAIKILHLVLNPVGDDYAEFRYFWDNPNDYQSVRRPLTEIKELIEKAERDYYTISPEDYAKTGRALYNWLDGSDRILQRAIDQHRRDGIVLAIAATGGLAHLPWEVLHDGQRFLIERRPAIIPVRWKADSRPMTWENQPENRALNVLFMATSPLGVEPVLDFEAEEGRILLATQRKPLSLIVEESGSLKEMRYLLENYEKDYFDVFHLTGHATEKDKKPCFITETELGEPEYSSAEDIADVLQFQFPKLIFLSGCETGYSWDKGTVPSMAEALLMEGATAVLSWGKEVSDTDTTTAAATLYENLSAERIVSRCLVFEIPVLKPALEAVCESISGYKEHLERAIELGLIEVSPESDKSKRVYRVSRILPRIIPTIRLPEEPKVYLLYGKASDKLYELWGNNENESEEQWREIFRLALVNKENPERFREQFYRMLKVQNNLDVDKVLESEFRKVRQELSEENLCIQLEEYLQQENWSEADKETAWIFYQNIIKNDYEKLDYLFKNFPCETLNKINQLWLTNSNGRFGFSVQLEIWGSVNENYKQFVERVGWWEGKIEEKGYYPFRSHTRNDRTLILSVFRMEFRIVVLDRAEACGV